MAKARKSKIATVNFAKIARARAKSQRAQKSAEAKGKRALNSRLRGEKRANAQSKKVARDKMRAASRAKALGKQILQSKIDPAKHAQMLGRKQLQDRLKAEKSAQAAGKRLLAKNLKAHAKAAKDSLAATSRGKQLLKKRLEKEKHAQAALTIIDVAVKNEFGLGVPERSFIRAYVDLNKDGVIYDLQAKLAMQIILGKMTYEQALNALGLKVQAGMQKRMADGIPPPNSPVTVARKGSSKPLIDIGQLRSSLTYRIKKA